MKDKRFAIVLDTKKCIDCKACTVACKVENAVPFGRENRRNWITEEVRGAFPSLEQDSMPKQCMHCGDPPCMEACPTDATGRDPSGIVTIDPKYCLGCKVCMPACPYDARYYRAEAKVVDKCSFCSHRVYEGRLPACVETCPTRVRVFGDLNDPKSEVAQLVSRHPNRVLKPEEGTRPFLFYLL